MNEEEKRNYLMNIINSTHYLVNDKLYTDNRKLNERNDFYRIKEYIDNFLENFTEDKFIIMPGLRGEVKLHCYINFMII